MSKRYDYCVVYKNDVFEPLKSDKNSLYFRGFECISHFFVLIYMIMSFFSQLFCNFGANSVHSAQKNKTY